MEGLGSTARYSSKLTTCASTPEISAAARPNALLTFSRATTFTGGNKDNALTRETETG
jgi:hypothetical protein